jgi:hypothetical protein
MSAAVVDENVPIVANDVTRMGGGLNPIAAQASDACRLAVVQFLRKLISSGVIVVDDGDLCISAYRRHLDGSGQPGTGDAFLRHLFENLYDERRVERVVLTSTSGEFDAFPKDPALDTFDRDDRHYVALTLASTLDPILANAVDSDYGDHRQPLQNAGVNVVELCAAPPAVTALRPRRTPKRPTKKKATPTRRRKAVSRPK